MPVKIALNTLGVRDFDQSFFISDHFEDASAFLAQTPQ
jgi:hypothetical protein